MAKKHFLFRGPEVPFLCTLKIAKHFSIFPQNGGIDSCVVYHFCVGFKVILKCSSFRAVFPGARTKTKSAVLQLKMQPK